MGIAEGTVCGFKSEHRQWQCRGRWMFEISLQCIQVQFVWLCTGKVMYISCCFCSWTSAVIRFDWLIYQNQERSTSHSFSDQSFHWVWPQCTRMQCCNLLLPQWKKTHWYNFVSSLTHKNKVITAISYPLCGSCKRNCGKWKISNRGSWWVRLRKSKLQSVIINNS